MNLVKEIRAVLSQILGWKSLRVLKFPELLMGLMIIVIIMSCCYEIMGISFIWKFSEGQSVFKYRNIECGALSGPTQCKQALQ